MIQEVEAVNLKSCPFCGGKAELKVADHPLGDCLMVRVNCSECHCASNSYLTGMTLGFPGHPARNVILEEAKEKAREAWNRRPNFGQLLERVKGKEGNSMRRLINTDSLSAEVTGIAMIILGLSNQLDDAETDVLTPGAMKDALFGISSHLERIAIDLGCLKGNEDGEKGAEI